MLDFVSCVDAIRLREKAVTRFTAQRNIAPTVFPGNVMDLTQGNFSPMQSAVVPCRCTVWLVK
ncbi:hypothetical protein [Symbiopectobacterium purcellii]|uniref:Uncharacterized protein n=1 Tax=Symbiopectobacterium purcellii TaxID=2871826 RepID=A0ABX9ALS5_9ENTR|nr:hypothetical protein [Symbiopectobacterium purcellii]QZN96133.1 hypothetical protein K6K13_01160 [Symbiopectobacterium purcellii]